MKLSVRAIYQEVPLQKEREEPQQLVATAITCHVVHGLPHASACLAHGGIFHNPLQQKQRSQIMQSRGSCQCQTDSRLDLEGFSLSTFIWKRLVINLELVPFSLRICSWSLIFANPFIISVLILFRLSTFLWISQQFCLWQGVLKNFCKWSG